MSEPPPLPCPDEQLLSVAVQRRRVAGDKTEVSREVWYIDKHGNKEWAHQIWWEESQEEDE